MKKLLLFVVIFSFNSFAMDKITLQVEGMTCPMCAGKVEKNLKANTEVSQVEIDIDKGEVKITLIEGKELIDDKISKAIEQAGYQVKDIKR